MLNETIREKITRILRESETPLSAREIAVLVGLPLANGERVVYEHLKHIAKTVWRTSHGKESLFMIPPKCIECGYVFKDLREPRKPSKCPRCKSQRIEPPRFKIMEYK